MDFIRIRNGWLITNQEHMFPDEIRAFCACARMTTCSPALREALALIYSISTSNPLQHSPVILRHGGESSGKRKGYGEALISPYPKMLSVI